MNEIDKIVASAVVSIATNVSVANGEKTLIKKGVLARPLIGENRLLEASPGAHVGTADFAGVIAFFLTFALLDRKKKS